MKDDLTGPERFAERALVQEKLDAAHKLGGCAVCSNRAYSAHGRGYCIEEGRTYPLCRTFPGPQFELDPPALDRITRKVA